MPLVQPGCALGSGRLDGLLDFQGPDLPSFDLKWLPSQGRLAAPADALDLRGEGLEFDPVARPLEPLQGQATDPFGPEQDTGEGDRPRVSLPARFTADFDPAVLDGGLGLR